MTVHRWTACLLLVGVVAATSLFAIQHHDGHDFIYSVWAPTRALIAGGNPYDPRNTEYLRRYEVPVSAALYMPSALLLHAPLALLSPGRAAAVVTVVNVVLIWLGVLVLIPPLSSRNRVLASGAGALVVLSAAADHTVELGQLSGLAFAGMTIMVWGLRGDAQATWLPSVGVALAALKPQSGIPLLVALGVFGYWRVLVRAAALIAVTSLPGAALLLLAARHVSAIIQTGRDNINLLSALPPNDLGNPNNLRIDALGLLSQLDGVNLTGLVWAFVAFLVVTALFVFAVRLYTAGRQPDLSDPYCVMLLTLYVVLSFYHLTYDQLLLFVGPLAALTTLTGIKQWTRSLALAAIGGIALAGAGIVFRPALRNRMIDVGLAPQLVHTAWVVTPTFIGIAVVAAGLAFRPRARGSEPLSVHERILA